MLPAAQRHSMHTPDAIPMTSPRLYLTPSIMQDLSLGSWWCWSWEPLTARRTRNDLSTCDTKSASNWIGKGSSTGRRREEVGGASRMSRRLRSLLSRAPNSLSGAAFAFVGILHMYRDGLQVFSKCRIAQSFGAAAHCFQ